MPSPPTSTPEPLAALGALEGLVRGWIREENEALFQRFCRELDRREQYGAAREILTDVLPAEDDEITATVAAKILRLSASNTLLQQLRRGDADLAACVLGGAGKARRFSRTKIKALAARRAG